MRLRLFDRVRRYIRPGPGGSRSRGSTRPGPPAVGGSVVVPPAGRHRRDHVPAPGQVSASSPVSSAMTGGAGALDGGGPVEPAPQVELPRRVRRARTGAGRAGPGTEPSGARPAGAGTAGTGPAGPWPPGAAGPGPRMPDPGTSDPGRQIRDRRRGHHRDQIRRTVDAADQAGRSRCHRDRAGGTRSRAPGRDTRNRAGHARNRASPGPGTTRREPAGLGLAGPDLARPDLTGRDRLGWDAADGIHRARAGLDGDSRAQDEQARR